LPGGAGPPLLVESRGLVRSLARQQHHGEGEFGHWDGIGVCRRRNREPSLPAGDVKVPFHCARGMHHGPQVWREIEDVARDRWAVPAGEQDLGVGEAPMSSLGVELGETPGQVDERDLFQAFPCVHVEEPFRQVRTHRQDCDWLVCPIHGSPSCSRVLAGCWIKVAAGPSLESSRENAFRKAYGRFSGGTAVQRAYSFNSTSSGRQRKVSQRRLPADARAPNACMT
jgi:hypothetical protein